MSMDAFREIRKNIPELFPNTVKFHYLDHLLDYLKVVLLVGGLNILMT